MTIDAIKADIIAKMEQKMDQTDNEAKMIQKKEIEGYYAGGTPNWYIRTGMLEYAPRTTGTLGGELTVSDRIWLNDGISYDTGSYQGAQVISATNEGHSGTVGNHGYWERMVSQIVDAFHSNFSSW